MTNRYLVNIPISEPCIYLCILIVSLISSSLTAGEKAVLPISLYKEAASEKTYDLKVVNDKVKAAVVHITKGGSGGSGFIIHEDGYLVTNAHVISSPGYDISVTEYERSADGLQKNVYKRVRIVAYSSAWDLALLKIQADGKKFKTVPLGRYSTLTQGQPVLALGSPLGLERVVTRGIISVPQQKQGGKLYIQHATPISPGNSGGPLFNFSGEVVGVNNMKAVKRGAEGLGFAIPCTMVKLFLDNLDAFKFTPRHFNGSFLLTKPLRASTKISKKDQSTIKIINPKEEK